MYFTRYGHRVFLLAAFLIASFVALALFLASLWQPPGGVFVLFVAIGGVVVAILNDNRPLTRNEKVGWLIFTGIATFLEICVLVRADTESKRAREAQNKSFSELLANAKDTIANMTGGDSFAYVDMEIGCCPPLMMPKLKVEGRYMLKDLQLRIIDVDVAKKMRSYRSAISIEEWKSTFSKIREFPKATNAMPLILDETCGIDLNPDADAKTYDFEIAASNGTWREYLRMRKIAGTWKKAIRVTEVNGTDENKWTVRMNDVPSEFQPVPALGPLPP